MAEAIEQIPLTKIDGSSGSLSDYAGLVRLVVNVASKCGLTPQYAGLEALYRAYRDQGLVVLGFPANDFAAQEPGTNEEIAEFCQLTYGVDFPMFAKIVATGVGRHPLYTALIDAQPTAIVTAEDMHARLRRHDITPAPAPEVLWNFEKFLISRDGQVVARFAPNLEPDDPQLVSAIEVELAKRAMALR